MTGECTSEPLLGFTNVIRSNKYKFEKGFSTLTAAYLPHFLIVSASLHVCIIKDFYTHDMLPSSTQLCFVDRGINV